MHIETEEAAEDSITAAAGWVRENLPELAANPPQITSGSTTGIMAEAPA